MTVRSKTLTTPVDEASLRALRCGEEVLISGTLYTARDAAHRKLVQAIENKEPLPFPLQNQILFYAGPCPAPPGRPIGSIGPTTAARMDPFTPPLLAMGLKGMIGKGPRSFSVRKALATCGAVYFAAIGGVAALLAQRIRNAGLVAYPELGPEAVWRLEVDSFPVVVVDDFYGEDLYETAKARYGVSFPSRDDKEGYSFF